LKKSAREDQRIRRARVGLRASRVPNYQKRRNSACIITLKRPVARFCFASRRYPGNETGQRSEVSRDCGCERRRPLRASVTRLRNSALSARVQGAARWRTRRVPPLANSRAPAFAQSVREIRQTRRERPEESGFFVLRFSELERETESLLMKRDANGKKEKQGGSPGAKNRFFSCFSYAHRCLHACTIGNRERRDFIVLLFDTVQPARSIPTQRFDRARKIIHTDFHRLPASSPSITACRCGERC